MPASAAESPPQTADEVVCLPPFTQRSDGARPFRRADGRMIPNCSRHYRRESAAALPAEHLVSGHGDERRS